MDIAKLQKPLPIENVDFRVQSIIETNNKVYAILLAYKDARVDMQRLDDVCGPLNRKREHTRDNKNCIVSIWNEETKQWISKEDTGTESMTEKEKGVASDSFKRACFNWGIGRELYSYPTMFVEMMQGEYYDKQGKKKASNSFLRGWKFEGQTTENGLKYLNLTDKKGNTRFTYGTQS